MDSYDILERLGEGSYATCWKGQHKITGEVRWAATTRHVASIYRVSSILKIPYEKVLYLSYYVFL
jgi:hypothetical protein